MFQIDDQTTTEETFDIFPDTAVTVYNPDYAAEKAERFGLVLGEASPGTDILTSDVASGQQEKWNQLLKVREDTNRLMRRNQILTEIAQMRDPSAPVTLDDLGLVEALSDDELYSSDLSTILEKKYSDLYTNLVSSYEENAVFNEAMAEDEDAALEVLDRSQYSMQRLLMAQDIQQSTQAKYDATSWGSWGLDFAKGFIPTYESIKGRERVETPTGSLLPGNNREEQISSLYALPPEEFKRVATQTIDELGQDNMILALEFANDILSFSDSDRAWGNLMPMIDVATVVSPAAVGKLAKGMAVAGKSVVTNPRNVAKMAASAGYNKTAAIATVAKNLASGDISGVTTMRRIEEVADRVPSMFAPQKWFAGGSKHLDAEAVARTTLAAQEGADKVMRVISEGTGLDRLTPEQTQRAAAEAFELVNDMFPSNSHKVIDQEIIPAELDRVTNTAVAEVRFGRQDGQLFKYEATARRYAEKYIGIKTDDFTVEQHSLGGYYVAVRKPLRDVGDFRSLEIESTIATPNTWNDKYARLLRSPDYLLSDANVQARGQAVGHVEYLAKVMDDATAPFRGKSARWNKEMRSMFESSQIQKKYYRSMGEFEDAFYKKFQKAPTEDQYDAYYRYVQLGDLDYIVRDADKVKRMTALGLEDFSYSLAPKNGQGPEQIVRTTGRIVDRLPLERKEPFRVRIVMNGTETHNIPNLMAKWGDNKELIEGLLSNGYKIIQDATPGLFTIVKDPKRNSIKLKTLGYIEGGHYEPKYDFYIRQGKVDDRDGAKVLMEDINLGTTPTLEQAKEIASVFEEARKLVKAKDPSAARFVDEHLPITYEEFIKKVHSGSINLDVPIVATAKGQRTSEVLKYDSIFGKNFYDQQSSEFNLLRETTPRYGTERSENLIDVYTADKGTVVKQEWSPILSPMDALASATRNMIDVRAMEDYAIKSTNDWVQEFGHLLDVNPEVLRSNPRYYMENPVWKSSIDRNKAEAARLSMLSLYRQIDTMDSGRNVIRDKVLSKIFDVSGERAREFFDTNWYSANDAQALVRKVAFHTKLGFWNAKQLFLQASSVAAAAAISPRSALMAGRALIPTRLALFSGDPKVINGLHNKFGKAMGWSKEDFVNMVDSLKQSGFGNVGGDHTYLDQLSLKSPGSAISDRVSKSPIGRLASTHTAFFNEGELTARIVGYATAYDEFLKRNPGKVPDRFQKGAILSRAKTFTQNMTRDSNARWQRGGLSVMTQFFSYHARVAEQLWDGGFGSGKKLTQAEKLRFIGTMSALYGGGTAVSMSLPVLPSKDILRDYLAEVGFDGQENPVTDLVLDGLATSLTEALIGSEIDFSGYGPTGLPTLYDLFNEDVGFAEALLGAGPGIMADLFKGVSDIAYGYGYGEGEVTSDDLLGLLRNISSVDNWTKLYHALNSGKYLSRSGSYVTDITQQEAWFQAIMGAAPERIGESFAKASNLKRLQDAQKEGLKRYEEYHRNAMRALDSDDEDSYRIYAKRRDSVRVAYDLLPSDISRINRRYFVEHPVSKQIDDRLQRWNTKYKLFRKDQDGSL